MLMGFLEKGGRGKAVLGWRDCIRGSGCFVCLFLRWRNLIILVVINVKVMGKRLRLYKIEEIIEEGYLGRDRRWWKGEEVGCIV